MLSKGKIGVIMPEIIDLINYEFLDGIHCQAQKLGYDEVNDICLNESAKGWLDAVSNGLVHLQRHLYHTYQHEQLEKLSLHDTETGLYNRKGFTEHFQNFSAKCSANGSVPYLLLVSDISNTESNERRGIDSIHMIANAIRLSSVNGELYARIESDIFAIAFEASPHEKLKLCIENHILSLEKKMHHIKESISESSLPELVSVGCVVGNDFFRISKTIDSLIDSISEKKSTAVNNDAEHSVQLQKLRREIYLSPQHDWSIPVILQRVRMSRSHFQRMYKSRFSINCIDDIIQARMEKAQQLLLHTDLRMQEIAEQCGYSSENYFSRQFKEKMGISTTNYRKNYKQ